MKTSCIVVVAVLAVFSISSNVLLNTAAEAVSSKQQEQSSWPVNHAHRIKRDVSSNHTSTVNRTQDQNVTTTRAPTKAPTYTRFTFRWPGTVRRNSARPTGSAMNSNLTGLTEVQIEKLKGNKSKVELDHLGFPKFPNSHRGTRQPSPLTKHNASNDTRVTPNPEKDRNGSYLHEMMADLREKGNGTQSSSTTTSTISIQRSSKVPQTDESRKHTHNDNRRDISLVISKHSIWIAVVASVILTAFSCVTVHWVRQRRRGKLTIAPASNKGQRSAAVVFKA